MDTNKSKKTGTPFAAELSMIDYLQYPKRSAQWDIITGEVQAVHNAYAHWGEEIPDATKQRMARRIVAFRQQWQSYIPETPLEETKTLTTKECQDGLWSFNDLQRHHKIIEAHHGHPDKVPRSSRQAMAQEKQDFHREIAEYQARQQEPKRKDFLTRLQTIREQQLQQKRKPQ